MSNVLLVDQGKSHGLEGLRRHGERKRTLLTNSEMAAPEQNLKRRTDGIAKFKGPKPSSGSLNEYDINTVEVR